MENRVHATKHCHWVMFVVLNVINLMAFLIEIKNFLDIVYIVCCVFLFKDLPPLMKDPVYVLSSISEFKCIADYFFTR